MRKTVEIDDKLDEEIKNMAKEKRWSFSKMAYVLLQNAVTEKNRQKRKNERKNTEESDMEG